jgi:hypothetical protein
MHKYELDVYFEKSPWLDPINTTTRRNYLFHLVEEWDLDKFNKIMQKCKPLKKNKIKDLLLNDIINEIEKVEAGYGCNN